MKNNIVLPVLSINLFIGAVSLALWQIFQGDVVWLSTATATLPLPLLLIFRSHLEDIIQISPRIPYIQMSGLVGVAVIFEVLFNIRETPATLLQLVAFVGAIFGFLSVQWYVWVYPRDDRMTFISSIFNRIHSCC